MAIKTFTTGEVLTAADTNTYLNNGGLVYIASSTFTTSSQVNFTNVFSSNYTQYRWVFSVAGTVAGTALSMRLGTGSPTISNTYGRIGFYWLASAVDLTAASQPSIFVGNLSLSNDYPNCARVDVNNPNNAKITSGEVWSQDMNSGLMVNTTLYETTTTQFTSAHFNVASGTITGTITAYGYRKA